MIQIMERDLSSHIFFILRLINYISKRIQSLYNYDKIYWALFVKVYATLNSGLKVMEQKLFEYA